MNNFDLKNYLAENTLVKEAEVTPVEQIEKLLRATAALADELMENSEYNDMYDWSQLSVEAEQHAVDINLLSGDGYSS